MKCERIINLLGEIMPPYKTKKGKWKNPGMQGDFATQKEAQKQVDAKHAARARKKKK